MFQIVCIYMIIFLRGQTYINIFIVYICPDENSVYFYLSCVPSSAILRGMITCYVSAYCKTQMHILPPECLQKTFSKGLLSNFPVSKRFFFPAYFSLCHTFGLLIQPRRVVSFPGNTFSAIQFQNPSGHMVEEVTVVRDADNRTRILL